MIKPWLFEKSKEWSKPSCVQLGFNCIEKTTRYTSGSKKPMAMSKKPCYDNSAVRQLHNIITGRDIHHGDE